MDLTSAADLAMYDYRSTTPDAHPNEVRESATTLCTDRDGDRDGRVCLCHWAPWFDGRGRPEDGPDLDYEPQAGDPLAGLAAGSRGGRASVGWPAVADRFRRRAARRAASAPFRILARWARALGRFTVDILEEALDG